MNRFLSTMMVCILAFVFIPISSFAECNAENAFDNSASPLISEDTSSSKQGEAPAEQPEYDALQTIFITISPSLTINELESLIADNRLCYTSKEYNASGIDGKSISYNIAFTDGVAKQSHADFGDYLDVTFDKDAGALMTAEYFSSSNFCTALLYCYGTWWDFSNNNAEDYSGYYLVDRLSKETGITIKYNNGRGKETKYFPYPSAEDLIHDIIASE